MNWFLMSLCLVELFLTLLGLHELVLMSLCLLELFFDPSRFA